ncbi:VWA domain-containing protein [Enterococcus sp. BWM-S5]|uniref:VWA domain-containing protein n=1 Tax=Enterococcus larvae TaxID=2794352 RepID=A0ABS4CK23_9ENTE|nr:vWA domain-containing protein [Enterococcus larvae]MBP1046466.1 VWA domain-containing protein [Enterococcus larvae]
MSKIRNNKGMFKLAALFLFFISMIIFSQSLLTTNAPIKANESGESAAARNQFGLDYGEVGVSKTATPVDGMVNQWDVTLRVEARHSFPPPAAEVVLIVDTSGSMSEGDRMPKAKEAAKSFVEQLLQDNYLHKISLITYDSTVTTHNFSTGQWVGASNRTELINTIEALDYTREGTTFTQAALKEATNIIKTATSNSRNIVLVSDGVPTISYAPKSPYNSLSGMEAFNQDFYPGKNAYQTVQTIPEDKFDYSVRYGFGKTYLSIGESPIFVPSTNSDDVLFGNHANSAIAEATISKDIDKSAGEKLITNIYTIGLDLDKQISVDGLVASEIIRTSKEVMEKVASSPDKSYDATPDDLEEILMGIAGEFVGNVKVANVTDPMGTGFTVNGTVTDTNASQGTVTVSGSAGLQTIAWDIGEMLNPISNDPDEDIMYAELTYRVDGNNDVLGVLDGNGLAETNGPTILDYTDAFDVDHSVDFKVPKVKPTIVRLKKELYDEDDQEITGSTEEFDVAYGNDQYTVDDTFKVKADGQFIETVHPWQTDTEYNVAESLTSSQKYSVSIDINGVPTSGSTAIFEFLSGTGDYDDVEIIVKNRMVSKGLNIRQVVLNPNGELVIPSRAFYNAVIDSSTATLNLTSGSTTLNTPAEVNESLFTKYKLSIENREAAIKIDDLVPEYYELHGYILTKDSLDISNKHISSNTADLVTTNGAVLTYDIDTAEYWLTMFIEPKLGTDSGGQSEDSPRPYSWDYEVNKFGTP